MKFIQHFSGSTGNLYEVTAENGSRLLIECGVTWKKMQRALKYDLKHIVGCFVSHGHKDHSKSIAEVARAGIDVFASQETLAKPISENPQFDHPYSNRLQDRRFHEMHHNTKITNQGGFSVLAFSTIHDCPGSLGFVVWEIATGEAMLFATDTHYIKPRFPFKFKYIAVECSYDGVILADKEDKGQIDHELAERLLTSHQEWRIARMYIREKCDRSNCTEIHLLHMSESNLNKEDVVKEFEDEFCIKVITT